MTASARIPASVRVGVPECLTAWAGSIVERANLRSSVCSAPGSLASMYRSRRSFVLGTGGSSSPGSPRVAWS